MVSFKFTALAFAALNALSALAQDGVTIEDVLENTGGEAPASTAGRKLAVDVQTSFPDAEIFGVKMVNGRPTRALLTITNNEPEPVTILIATGSLLTPSGVPGAPEPPTALRNLTIARYASQLAPASKETFTYSFTTIMHPQDLTLELKVLVQSEDSIFTLTVFREHVAIVEAPVSIFDPQIIFLYIFLAGAFAGTCYFIYSTWITTLFPQKKRTGKSGERTKRSNIGTKKAEAADQVPVAGADGPAVTSGAKAYDESWIPAGHLKRPEPKRVGSGRPKSRAA